MKLKHSQNFLHNPYLVEKLIKKSLLRDDDIVIEIGPGEGIITSTLIKQCRFVVAIEADEKLANELKDKYKSSPNLEIYHGDFLTFELPKGEYKVFSNIPFSITADIMRKLFDSGNPPVDSYLIIQKEAALKYSGIAKENLFSILHKPWFSLSIIHSFNRSDFVPRPAVDIVMLRIKKLKNPLISDHQASIFKDFVAYGFTSAKATLAKGFRDIFSHEQFKRLARDNKFLPYVKPSDLIFEQWLAMFQFFVNNIDKNRQEKITGSYMKLLKQQEGLEKIHRTRTAKDWQRICRQRN